MNAFNIPWNWTESNPCFSHSSPHPFIHHSILLLILSFIIQSSPHSFIHVYIFLTILPSSILYSLHLTLFHPFILWNVFLVNKTSYSIMYFPCTYNCNQCDLCSLYIQLCLVWSIFLVHKTVFSVKYVPCTYNCVQCEVYSLYIQLCLVWSIFLVHKTVFSVKYISCA